MLMYIEPCGWCASGISSLKRPSQSSESSYQRSSSSQFSFSLSQKSLESHQKTAFSTPIIRSTYSHPHDYHSRKRIDELHERLDEIQIRNFLKFINYHLALNKSDVNLQIDDFISDLSNGHIFLDLIEKFSSTKLPRERGRTRFHSLTNVQHALDYFKSHRQHINISSNDVVSGNRKSILALLWMIMKYFDFPNFRLINRNCFQEKTLLSSGQDRSMLLNWLNHLLNQCLINQQNILKDFYIQTWINGYYLSLILKYLVPISENYSSMKSFDYLKQLNTNSCERCFEICLNLSNYCFHTSMTMNYDDKTEISLLKYFSDLQRNIFQLIQSDHLSKLVQINPYTKQILQTIEHSTNVINANEQYLVCIQESDSIEVERLNEKRDKNDIVSDEDVDRFVLKEITSNIDHNNQTTSCTNEKENVCLTIEFNEPVTINPVEQITNVSIELPLVEEIHDGQLDQLQSEEQTISISHQDKQFLEQTIDEEENIEPPVLEIAETKACLVTIEESVQPIIFTEESTQISSVNTPTEVVDQTAIEIPLELMISCDEKETKYVDNEIEITSNHKFEEQPSNTFAENVNNQLDEFLGFNENLTRLPSTKFELSVAEEVQPSVPVVKKEIQHQQKSVFVVKDVQPPVSVMKEAQPSAPAMKEEVQQQQKSIFIVKDIQPPVSVMKDEIQQQQKSVFIVKEAQSSTLAMKEAQPSVPVVKEVQQPSIANGYKNSSTYHNKKYNNSPRKCISNNSNSQSTISVDKSEVRQISSEISVQATAATPVRCSKYSDVVNQSIPSMRKEQTVVPKKKVIPNEPPKQSIIITEEIRTVPPKQSEPVQLAAVQQEQPKKSSKKNKKSRRSNAKKAQTQNTLSTTETPSQSIIDDQPISLVVDDPEPVIEVQNTPSSALRSRRSRKKKTTATKSTTVIEKTQSTNTNATDRNLFVVVKECIRDRTCIAFKCVIILVCLCFSIIILVLSHK